MCMYIPLHTPYWYEHIKKMYNITILIIYLHVQYIHTGTHVRLDFDAPFRANAPLPRNLNETVNRLNEEVKGPEQGC